MASLADFALVEGKEFELTDPNEMVWRLCATAFIDDTSQLPTDQIFAPTKVDQGKLSVARSSKASAASAYQYRTEVMKKSVAGAWGVTVDEIKDVGARVVDDSALQAPPPPPPSPGHAYIDMRAIATEDKQARQRFRSTLLISAVNRGRAHPTATSEPD